MEQHGRDLRDCPGAQPVPGGSPGPGDPGSPARDEQSVLTAVAALQSARASNATKTQDIITYGRAKLIVPLLPSSSGSRMPPVVLAGRCSKG